MRLASTAAALLTFLVASCAAPQPIPAADGPHLTASLAAEWPTAGPGRQLVFSRDGSRLASADALGRIVVRQVGSWRPIAAFDHTGGATSVAFWKDGNLLFSSGYDGAIRSWDVKRRSALGASTASRSAIWSLDVSPDGKRLASGGEDGLIRIWPLDRRDPPLVARGHQRNVWEASFSPDGRRLASGSFDRSARLWDAATGKQLRTLSGHSEAIVGLEYSPGGDVVATGSDDSTIRLWRASDGRPLRRVEAGNHVYDLAFSPDGRWLASAGRARGGLGGLWHQLTGRGGNSTPVRLWRVRDAGLVASLPHSDDVMYLAISPDGRWLATSGEAKQVRLWRLSVAPS